MNCNCRGNREEYLLVSSCHPQHTKRAIPFSLALRLRRICANPDNYKLRTNELTDYLANRGYDKTFLRPGSDAELFMSRT